MATIPLSMAESGPGRTVDLSAALARHEAWLRRVVHARVGEPQAVDEVMQEVSLAAVRQDAPLRDAAKAPAWLYRLAVRQALLYRRRCGRRRKRLLRLASWRGGEIGANAEPNPLDWLLAAERRDHVRAALQRLPGRDGDLLMLKYGEGWSYKRIAEHLDMTEPAVESRLHRARARLRSELASMRMDEQP